MTKSSNVTVDDASFAVLYEIKSFLDAEVNSELTTSTLFAAVTFLPESIIVSSATANPASEWNGFNWGIYLYLLISCETTLMLYRAVLLAVECAKLIIIFFGEDVSRLNVTSPRRALLYNLFVSV